MNPLPSATSLDLYRSLLRIRLIEERIASIYSEQEIRCPTHFSIGQEAVPVGISACLDRRDHIISAHRSHAHYLAKGGSLQRMVCELYGKENGCAGGKGGSMHLQDHEAGVLGCTPIVGSSIAIGAGAAFGDKLQGNRRATVVYFGDGATETGIFHESINFASIHKVPVIFVCENNLYSVNTSLAHRQPPGRSIKGMAEAHHVKSFELDGQDVEAVYSSMLPIVRQVKDGGGPVFVECFTYRYLQHCGPYPDHDLGYRTLDEINDWKQKDPVLVQASRLRAAGLLSTETEEALRPQVHEEIDEAFALAKRSSFPARAALYENVYCAD